MKKVVLLVAVMALISSSHAIIDVNWIASGGFYFNANPSVGILGDGTGNSTIAQLMYSPDNVKDNILTSMAGDVNDVIWDTVTITENGIIGDFDDFAFFLGNENYTNPTFTSGYVYALIFQDNNVQVNDWYAYTPLYALVDVGGVILTQSIELNTDTINGNAIDVNNGVSVAQVIPEPTTALLFGIGAMGAWLVRRNKIKSKEEADA